MKESNIYFSTNTYNCEHSSFNTRIGDADFLHQIKDYNALVKLRNFMGGTFNSRYYVATKKQIDILDPNFAGVMLNNRKPDPEILEQNKKYDAEYGYPKKNNFYPLLEEIILEDEEITYADEILGKWLKQDEGRSTDDNPFGIYIKQKTERDNGTQTVSPEESGIEDIEDKDPYYYIYDEFAGKGSTTLGNSEKTKIYEEKYGSIFRAFEEVPQETIIKAPVNQFSFINAGPGTGKTYTLMEKIKYMIDELEVDPEGILVLCFTNAAVNEIKSRIKKYAEDKDERLFINIDVRTFHSFSWLLISQANELFIERPNYHYIDISKLNYDESIRRATDIIRKFGDEVFGGCNHLIVDEIQDLTNERASLVLSMVQECIDNNVGITVLGDSCQAIYDYADEDDGFIIKSDRFYKQMFEKMYELGKYYKLEKNHRQTERLIKVTQPLRKAILCEKKIEVLKAIKELNSELTELTTGALSVKYSEYSFNRLSEDGTVCLLCRNNAQVLSTSTNLRKRGIPHIVNAYNEFEYLAEWIGKIFGTFSKNIITYDEFNKLIEKQRVDIEVNQVWERLQDIIGSENNVLKVSTILESIAKSKVDDPIFRNVPKGKLIVSNVHKSKGREYDTVVIEKKFINKLIMDTKIIKSVSEYLEEAKVLYVAATRPRIGLYCNKLASTDVSLKRISTGRKRWVRGDGNNLKRVEVRALTDVDIDSFDNLDIQHYIIQNVNIGDEVKLVMDNSSMNVIYKVVHISENGERVIGKTSKEFVDDIDAIITPYESPWPKRIIDIYVSGIHTQISSDYNHAWCWVDFCGIGTAYTDVY